MEAEGIRFVTRANVGVDLDARQLATGALVPAVRKMAAAIEASASPFCPVIQAIDRLLAVVVAAHPEVSHA